MTHNMALRRHGSVKRTGEIGHLPWNHPAIAEGRPLFSKSVVSVENSPRLLVSGHNNRKIGKRVTKGEWAGMPIFTLTLAERSTCPRQCFMFGRCYGDAMPFARRHEHGPELEQRLAEEVAAKAAEHPKGFVVRLHVLGDFYSAAYVHHWMGLLQSHKELHVWGYTARDLEHDPKIALMIEMMNDLFADRCNIRFSSEQVKAGGVTVFSQMEMVPSKSSLVVCPAETHRSECCATCALCWSKNAREKTIAFIEHGGVKKK